MVLSKFIVCVETYYSIRVKYLTFAVNSVQFLLYDHTLAQKTQV